MKNKEVLILFKTHLDVGFTDYSEAHPGRVER